MCAILEFSFVIFFFLARSLRDIWLSGYLREHWLCLRGIINISISTIGFFGN